MKRDKRTVQARWEAAQDTMDCASICAPCIPGCTSPRFDAIDDINAVEWRHRAFASMQLDGIDHRRLP